MGDGRRGSPHDIEYLATRLYAAVVSDALDSLGAAGHIVGSHIRPVTAVSRPLIGRAATARSMPVGQAPERPYATLLEAIDALRPADVLVIAAEDGMRSAIFGGLLATAARARGAVGCIVDGPIRDTGDLTSLGFPTFAAGFSPADSFGRDEIVEYGCVVHLAGAAVHPGDLLVADNDGVVVVPALLEEQVVEYALAKDAGEGNMRVELAEGLPVAEAFEKYGIL